MFAAAGSQRSSAARLSSSAPLSTQVRTPSFSHSNLRRTAAWLPRSWIKLGGTTLGFLAPSPNTALKCVRRTRFDAEGATSELAGGKVRAPLFRVATGTSCVVCVIAGSGNRSIGA